MSSENYKIAIIGLGYVGLPLAIEFGKKFQTIGFDKSKERINQLNDGVDKTLEVSKGELKASKLLFTIDSEEIGDCNIYIVTVPTPVDKHNNPNMYPLSSASKTIGNVLNKRDIVIYESTVYPGATEEFCVPILEKESKLIYNKDFFCGYSPERINPGDKDHRITNIKKITSGSNSHTATIVDKLYKSIIPAGTHKAPSIATAEASKVIENIQRDVNIALINELSMIFNKLNIDTSEVLKAAETKWNFLPFRPGLVGGHCIGVDPYYLTHKAREINYHPEMILAGRRINDSMGSYVAENAIIQMTKNGINPEKSKVALLGLTFKENCPDLRNTRTLDIINHFLAFGCEVLISDPYADEKEAKELFNIDLLKLNQISNCNSVVIAVAHSSYKKINKKSWENILIKNGVLIDVKSVFNKDYFKNTSINHWRL